MSLWSGGKRTTLNRPADVTDCFLWLSDEQPLVKLPTATVFAIDGAYPAIKPDIYITCENENKAVLTEPFIKVFRKKFQRKYSGYENLYFCDLWMHARGISGMWHVNPDNFHALWCGSTLGVALSIIVFMGYSRINFCGATLHGYEHYRDRVFIAEFAEIAQLHGIDCNNCMPHSSLNSFLDYIPLK